MDHAIEVLKQAASKHKKNADVHTALGELNSIAHLLKLSSSRKVSKQLTEIFHDKFFPLFDVAPLQALEFCGVVVDILFKEKIKPARDVKVQFEWELTTKQVISTALDFIEYKPSSSNKSAAKKLVDVLCDIFYRQSALYEWKSPTLIFNLNTFLSVVAAEHPESQRLLRNDKVLGMKRMGYVLSQSRDYYTIDSILTLVAPILPTRDAAAKRRDFLAAHFPQDLFPCSTEIIRIIEDYAGKDWDDVVKDIIECLAKTDISFPQPIDFQGAQAKDTKLPDILTPIYVDRVSLHVNFEDNDIRDCYQIPYHSIECIKLVDSAEKLNHIRVTVELNAHPLIGPRTDPVPGKCSLIFDAEESQAEIFVETLKARGEGSKIRQPERKVSMLAEGNLSLEFDSGGRKPATQQEKVAKVEKLWQEDRDLAEPTSPLLGGSTRSDSVQDAIYGVVLSDMSDQEDGKPKSKSKPNSKEQAPRVVRIVQPSSEDEEEAPVAQPGQKSGPRKTALKKMAVVESEDEEDSPPPTNTKDSDFEPTQQEPQPTRVRSAPTRVARGAAAAKSKAQSKAEESEKAPELATAPVSTSVRRARATGKSAPPVELSEDEMDVDEFAEKSKGKGGAGKAKAKAGKEIGETQAAKERGSKNTGTTRADDADLVPLQAELAPRRAAPLPSEQDIEMEEAPPSETVKAKGSKRTARDSEDEEEQDRSRKRLRPEEDSEAVPPPPPPRRVSSVVFGTSNPPLAKKRYGGRKGRGSSPAVANADAGDVDMGVNFDEIPAESRSPPSPAPVAEKKKEKKQKQQQEPLEPPPKGRVAAMKGKAGQKVAPVPVQAPPKAKAAPVVAKKKQVQDEEMQDVEVNLEIEKQVKPAGRTTRASKPVEQQPAVTQAKLKPEKPRKAPWQDMHLRKKADDVGSSDPPVPEYEEYQVPLKGSSSSDPPPPQDDQDVTMIDPVQDDALPQVKKIVQIENEIETHVDSLPPAVPDHAVEIPPAALPAVVSPSRHINFAKPAVAQHSSPVVAETKLPPAIAKIKSQHAARSSHAIQPSTSLLRKHPLTLTPVHHPPTPPSPVRQPPAPARPTVRHHAKEAAVAPPLVRAEPFTPVQKSSLPERDIFRDTHSPAAYRHPQADAPRRVVMDHHANDDEYPSYKYDKDGRIRNALAKINEAILENIAKGFEDVEHDARMGATKLIRAAAADMDSMCTTSEGIFNSTVDLAEEYSTQHRKILHAQEDLLKSAEVMENELGQIILHHDRHSLSKKLPTTLFTLPASVRKPVLTF